MSGLTIRQVQELPPELPSGKRAEDARAILEELGRLENGSYVEVVAGDRKEVGRLYQWLHGSAFWKAHRLEIVTRGQSVFLRPKNGRSGS